MERIVEVLPDKAAITRRSLELVIEKMQAAIQARDRFTIALSGGSTPQSLYEAIATQDLPWEKIHVFWGDERYVPSDHPESNQLMTRRAWLDKVSLRTANIHPMPTDGGSPVADAEKYEVQLREFFGSPQGVFPEFDLILLGLGDDAHTASLFPQTTALHVDDRFVTVGDKDGQPRLTFTAPLINHAHCVIFLVAGESKRHAIAQVFAPDADAQMYPARLIQPQGELWWLLDESAAQALNA